MAKQLKTADLRGKTEDELQAVIMEQRKSSMDQRFAQAQGKLADTSAIKAARRTVARAKTLQTEIKSGIKHRAPKTQSAAKPKAAKTTSRSKKKEG